MGSTVAEHDAIALESLLQKAYRDSGHAFREYKRGTLIRRLEKRLHATGTRTYWAYMEFLDTKAKIYRKNGSGDHA